MAQKESTQVKKPDKNGKEGDWEYGKTFFALIKDVIVTSLAGTMNRFLPYIIIAITTFLSNFVIFKFRSLMKNKWNGKIKTGIMILVYVSSTLIPLGYLVVFQNSKYSGNTYFAH